MIKKLVITTKSGITEVGAWDNMYLSYMWANPHAKGRAVIPDNVRKALWMNSSTLSRGMGGKRIIGKIRFYKT